MDCLEEARALYGEYCRLGSGLSQDKQASLTASMGKLIRSSLLQQGGSASFRYPPFSRVIQRTVGANRFQGDEAATAFLALEKYLVLLAQQPWKREFWLLKLYGGYFCTKVRAHLEGAEEILQLIGFMPEHVTDTSGATATATATTVTAAGGKSALVPLCLVLLEAPDPQVALNVAFDCQVAALECQFIGEYYGKMQCVGLDLTDAMNVLMSGASSDVLLGGTAAGELGGSGGVLLGGGGPGVLGSMKVSYNPGSVLTDVYNLPGRGPLSTLVKPHTVLASGGMGMGVVTGAGTRSLHQVIGVQPSFSSSSPSSTSSHHAAVSTTGSGGGVTHQVIGVSATHHHHHPHRSTLGSSSGSGGSFQTTGGVVLSRPAPGESYNLVPVSSVAATVSSLTSVARGSGTTVGAGHSVLHVTGVPASTTAPPLSHHHVSDDLSSRKAFTPTPIPTPTPAPTAIQLSLTHHHLSSPIPSSVVSPLASHPESTYSSCPAADTRLAGEGLNTVLLPLPPPSQQGLMVGGDCGRGLFMGSSSSSHPSSVAYQQPGSRGSYASSGFVSGSVSVLSGGSSAHTASSGYCSSSPLSSASQPEYVNLPIRPASSSSESVHVDPSHHHHNLTQLSRPSRAQSQKPQFPSIEEDEFGFGAPFPEATHEEHMKESLRNLQDGHPEKTQKRSLSKNLTSQLASGHPAPHQQHPQTDHRMNVGSEPHALVTYDDWRWFRDSNKALASPGKLGTDGVKMHGGSGIVNVPPSTILRPSNSGGHSAPSSMSASHMDSTPSAPQHHLMGVPSPPPQQQQLLEGSNWKATMTPNPVYYPPGLAHKNQPPDDLYCNTASSMIREPLSHPYPTPSPTHTPTHTTTIVPAQKGASSTMSVPFSRWEERVGGQVHSSPSPAPLASPIYNNLDRTPVMAAASAAVSTTKVLNVAMDVNKAQFEMVKKQDGVLSPSKGRAAASSMVGVGVAPHYANLMDLSVGERDRVVGERERVGGERERVGGGHSHSAYSSEVWMCETCTMVNEARSSVCHVCGRSRGCGDSSPGMGVGAPPFCVAGESRRVCPSCTFENPPGCRSCEVCEVLLPQDVHTYV